MCIISDTEYRINYLWSSEKAMAPHSSTLAGKSHGRRRSLVGYSPWGLRRVGHDWATSLSLFTFMHWRRKWQPLQCSCLENPRDSRLPSMGSQSQTWLKRLSSSSLWSYFPFLDLCCYLAYFWFFKFKVRIVFLGSFLSWCHDITIIMQISIFLFLLNIIIVYKIYQLRLWQCIMLFFPTRQSTL